jgi:Trypsin
MNTSIRRLAKAGSLAAALALPAPAAFAQTPAPQPDAPVELGFDALADRPQEGNGPFVMNAQVVDTAQWPATFRGTFTIAQKAYNCTATLVSDRALLTAAHCVADGGQVVLRRSTGPDPAGTWRGRCERAPGGYPGVISADWALCRMDQPVPATHYERISLQAPSLAVGDSLRVAGFGCTERDKPADGLYRIGRLHVQHLPGGFDGHPHFIVSRPAFAVGDAAICQGDSGGPSFVTLATGRRLIVAVNSHHDTEGKGVSMLSALWTEQGARFVRDWAERHGERLCGEHANAQNCR